MSESISAIQVASYIVAIIPSIYFLYKIVREAIYYFKHDDEDIL